MSQESTQIGEHTIVLRVMPYKQSRRAVNRLLRITANGQMHDDAAQAEMDAEGLSTFMVAAMTGRLTEEDVDFLCDFYAPYTDIVMPGTTNVKKFDDAMQEAVFRGDLELMYRWLDACTTFHFGETLKKFSRGHKTMEKVVVERVRRANDQTPADPDSQTP